MFAPCAGARSLVHCDRARDALAVVAGVRGEHRPVGVDVLERGADVGRNVLATVLSDDSSEYTPVASHCQMSQAASLIGLPDASTC